MRIILFDLGQTLEDNGVLLPGAANILSAIQTMKDPNEELVTALVSDYYETESHEDIEVLKEQYYKDLEKLGLQSYFQPLSQKVTLSTEVGVRKPDERIFRTAIDKIYRDLPFHHVIFIADNLDHVIAARELGMTAIHFQGPGQSTGELSKLVDLIPIIGRLLMFSPCGKKRNEAVGRTVSQNNKSKQVDHNIEKLISLVDKVHLQETISHLVQLGTRWSYSSNISHVPEWIYQRLIAIGYRDGIDARYQNFDMPGSGTQRNVICRSLNNNNSDNKGLILVCSHYDSLSEKPSVSAPGADDDASGVAATLELARLLRNIPLKRDVLFCIFGGEEQGLFGSEACAEIAIHENWAIDVVINLDMISYKNPIGTSRIVVEYDQGNRDPRNDAAAKAYGLIMAKAAKDYTSLEVEHTDIWNSDYMSFEKRGYACIGAYNAEDNPFYHKSSDNQDKIDITHLGEVVKMVLATILILGR
jgi:Peptidase family M28/Haloacid dehalogenase-like hydrolase